MSDEQELKLQCLQLANGDVERARDMFEWLGGIENPQVDPLRQEFQSWATGDKSQAPDWDSELYEIFDNGISFAINSLAYLLDVKHYTPSDGSESLEGDVSGTLANILIAAGYRNEDGDLAKPHEIAKSAALEAPAQPVHPDAELRSVTPATEEESGDQFEASTLVLSSDSMMGATDATTLPGGVEESRDHLIDAQTCEEVDPRCSWKAEPAPCTCHPDDAPMECMKRYAASECQAAYSAKYFPIPAEEVPPQTYEDEADLAPEPDALAEFMKLPGAVKWGGGECPLSEGADVAILTRGCGSWSNMRVMAEAPLGWQHSNHPTDIIAYRIIEAPASEQDAGVETANNLPEGFVRWEGGGYAAFCKAFPARDGMQIEVIWRNGERFTGEPAGFAWDSAKELLSAGWRHEDAVGGKITDADDIIAYRVIEKSPEPSPYAEAVEKGAITQDEADFLISERERIAADEQAKFFGQGMMADADRHAQERSMMEKAGEALAAIFKREREDA